VKTLGSKFIFIIVFLLISVLILSVFDIYKKQELNSFLELQTQEAENRLRVLLYSQKIHLTLFLTI